MPDGTNVSVEAANILPPVTERQQEIRHHSKLTPEGLKARNETAFSIRNERRTRDKATENISVKGQKIADINAFLGELSQKEVAASVGLEAIRKEILANSTSLLGRTLDRLNKTRAWDRELIEKEKLRELDRIRRALESEEISAGQLADSVESGTSYKQSISERVKKLLTRFYETQGEKLNEASRIEARRIQNIKDKEELEIYIHEHGGVEELVREKNVYIVHATNLDWTSKKSTEKGFVKDNNLDLFEKRMDKVVADSTRASAVSSITPGDKAYTFDDIGIIVRSGTVSEAWSTDQATHKDKDGNLRTRASAYSRSSSIWSYRQSIEDAIASPAKKKEHNEFALEGQIEFAGMFLNFDWMGEHFDQWSSSEFRSEKQMGNPFDGSVMHRREMSIPYSYIFAKAEGYGLPVFAFENGVAYKVILDKETGHISKGEEVSPVQMLDRNRDSLPVGDSSSHVANQLDVESVAA